MSFRHISILGLGLIGGSIGLAAKRSIPGCCVKGYDLSTDVIRRAQTLGVVDDGYLDIGAACAGADLVVLCVPVGALGAVIRGASQVIPAGACVTDVSSTKRSAVKLAYELLPQTVRFVGAHPMAGGELCGIDAARADLFHHAQCLLTPTARSDPKAVVTVTKFWQSLGMETLSMSPEKHDALVAEISHLPHAIASAIMAAVSDEALSIAGPGFRDVTRVSAGDGALWQGILQDNADELRRLLKKFRSELDSLEAMLSPGKEDALRNWLNTAGNRRRTIGRMNSHE